MQLKHFPVINADNETIDHIVLGENGTIEQAAAKLDFLYGDFAPFLTFGKPVLLPSYFSVQMNVKSIKTNDALQVYGYECQKWDNIKQVCEELNWEREFAAHGYKKAVFCPPLKTVFCFK